MEVERMNYKNLVLKEMVIPKLREDITRLNNNVLYDFPKTDAKFPLVVLNVSDMPLTRDIQKREILSSITVKVSILEDYQSECMDLEYDITTCMLDLGFTRLEPTEPYKNESYDKFQIDIRYKIRYNAITKAFEMTL
jgi:hypothetical protein